MSKIHIIIESTNTGYSAYVDEIPVATTGETLEKLMQNIVEAIKLYTEEKKTSKQWWDDDPDHVVIKDPDGWDRSNFQFSYFEELITKEEFDKRLAGSTCLLKPTNRGGQKPINPRFNY